MTTNLEFNPDYDWMLVLHLIVNGFVFDICICRLGRMYNVLERVKLQYTILMVASVANGLSPIFFRQWPTLVSICYAGAVLYMLWSDSYQWRNGPPEAAITDTAPLSEVPEEKTNAE